MHFTKFELEPSKISRDPFALLMEEFTDILLDALRGADIDDMKDRLRTNEEKFENYFDSDESKRSPTGEVRKDFFATLDRCAFISKTFWNKGDHDELLRQRNSLLFIKPHYVDETHN